MNDAERLSINAAWVPAMERVTLNLMGQINEAYRDGLLTRAEWHKQISDCVGLIMKMPERPVSLKKKVRQ